ncbi:MAG: AsmA-like C-terminal region-containing protein [Flavobacteriales bacterium]|nr:AsmA-like C-terminal region-containing protein [Flavobacteriales bacterium]
MKKIFKWIGITILVVLILLITLPFLFKGKIIEAIKGAANEQLNAKVEFEEVSLSLLTNFPNLRIKIEKFTVQNTLAPFDSVMLAEVGSLETVVDVMSLFGDQIGIKRIGLVNPNFDVRVTKEGLANWDIMKADPTAGTETPSDTSAAATFNINLEEYYIENGNLSYNDQSLPFFIKLDSLNHRGAGDFTEKLFTLNTTTEIGKLTTSFDGVTYAKNMKTDIKADLEIVNEETMRITFKENEFKLNELLLTADGWFSMPPDGSYEMDIKYAMKEAELRRLLSMIPAEFASDVSGVKASGNVAFNGFVKGQMTETSMPGFGVNLSIENGKFQYPDLPKSVDNIQVKATIDASDGNDYDKMKIDVDKFHFEMAQNPVDIVLKLRSPMSDPDIDFVCKANLDLDKAKEFIPLEQGDEVHGQINADVQLKGRMSAVEQERYADFYAAGLLEIKNVMFHSDSLPYDMNVNSARFEFSPQFIDLSNFSAQIGKSDIAASGKIEDYLQYALKDSLLSGNFSVTSNLLDLNEFMTEEEAASTEATTATPAEASEIAPIELPGNVDFGLNADFKKVIFGENEITNMKGNIRLKDEIASMSGVSLNVLDGAVGMNGSYNAQNISQPKVNFDYDIRDMDINKLATQFNTIEKLAPIAKSCNGKFSSYFNLIADLNGKMEPIDETVNGKGTLSTKSVTINDFKPLVKIAEVTKLEKLRNQSLNDVNVSFKIENGVVFVDPFVVKLDGIPATISGSTNLKQEIDYKVDLEIPFEKFPQGAVNQANSLLAMANEKLGTNISAGSKLPVKLNITGTVLDPKISTNYGDLGKDAVNNLKDELVDKAKEEAVKQLTDLKDDALEKAMAEKERLVKEAEAARDKALAEAQAVADKAKLEAKNAAQKGKDLAYAEAKKIEDSSKNPLEKLAKKKLADEARKKADEIYTKALNEANKKADAGVNAAKAQGDKLVADANAKGDKMIADANAKSSNQINKVNE